MSDPFLQLRIEADQAVGRLHAAVVAACPGYHQPILRRDGKPKWCNECGRDNTGFLWRGRELPR